MVHGYRNTFDVFARPAGVCARAPRDQPDYRRPSQSSWKIYMLLSEDAGTPVYCALFFLFFYPAKGVAALAKEIGTSTMSVETTDLEKFVPKYL